MSLEAEEELGETSTGSPSTPARGGSALRRSRYRQQSINSEGSSSYARDNDQQGAWSNDVYKEQRDSYSSGSNMLAGQNGLGSLADELGGDPGASGPTHTGSDGKGTQGASLADEFGDNGAAELASDPARSEEYHARRQQEHHLYVSETLSDSVRQINAFLDKLRRVGDVTAFTGMSSQAPRRKDLPSADSSSSLAAGAKDDTATIEDLAAAIVKHLREQTVARETQVRELQECDRILRRAFEDGGELLTALAEAVDQHGYHDDSKEPIMPYERDPLGIAAAQMEDVSQFRHSRADMSNGGQEADEETPLSPAHSLRAADMDSLQLDAGDAGGRASAFGNLVRLQQSTRDLVFSLSVIHEHSQIAHASMRDASRRIRNIRTVLSNWQTELRSLEEGQAWIAAWEGVLSNGGVHAANGTSQVHTPPMSKSVASARAQGAAAAAARPVDIKAWTQSQLDKFEHILDDAHVRAKELLKPVKDPVLDQLAAGQA